jgi:hypothetical protein
MLKGEGGGERRKKRAENKHQYKKPGFLLTFFFSSIPLFLANKGENSTCHTERKDYGPFR